MKKVIAYNEIGDTNIGSASELAETFNCHFANIGHELVREISTPDTVPESYPIQIVNKKVVLFNRGSTFSNVAGNHRGPGELRYVQFIISKNL